MKRSVLILGGGPAGLMAAECLSAAGLRVTVCEAMPTFARKFLLAGKSGLNLTHSEGFDQFRTRFGRANAPLAQALEGFPPDAVRRWAADLGSSTFVGSSGRVFPHAMKASPLLRAWLRRLSDQGVTLLTRHRFLGFAAQGGVRIGEPEGQPEGERVMRADAVLFAFGGASWPRLGSDAAWVASFRARGIEIDDFRPANCGFDCAWSDVFRTRFAGAPVKSVIATSPAGSRQGEFVISRHGIEGSLVYAHASALRDRLEQEGRAELLLDLAPGRGEAALAERIARLAPGTSLANRLRKAANLDGVKAALLRECCDPQALGDAKALAHAIKNLPIPLVRPRPIAEAISSAGGVRFAALNEHFMLKALPGFFCAGEMIDWEAPTGGYLLTACFATGKAAADGILAYLDGEEAAGDAPAFA
ncbi:TIGR03862 family flavoprotein [Rhizobium sp. SSA_523]|uniref:TIGR03862 family flavoprotein n=1 Tax=Rhizobium sp. SSA_523 TaxID=2952477 RepID=UPI002090CEC4|nr:TIGR03862 family flavoprotein [Rhizobium sp. SSA_523]MCO5732973.1 TIGR03862 family flavoprotein [Rhizobium sp. SSA_523]WKC23857.1 TIGR03862 family flavoprotein [Rhizobium sp. SSA_523]